ncbi:MAG: HAD-IC family P-type ATPase [Candidatus Kapabacteria bacterium]|nr:HAD-IC family P-type ATPase [Candidatus Kapabacteria bacterium]
MLWHAKSINETLENFKVDPKIGLRENEVTANRRKYGENAIISKKNKAAWLLLLEQFNNPVIIILIVSAILTAILKDYNDTIVIAFVVILNTIIGFVQERRAADALNALKKLASPVARVIRNGQQTSIATNEVVCGDILVLESGMRSPADGRLIDTHNFLVDESMLTGESFSINKKHDTVLEDNLALGDKINMIYGGTIIQKGRGLAVVTSVGEHTEFGKISKDIAEAEESESPLQNNIAKFGKWLSLTIIVLILVIFLIGLLQGVNYLVMFLTSVGLAVSAIPEGLPVAVTITLSIGIRQMAKNKAIVKKLAAVETLGSTNVICTDKTGTLTRNQMIVTRFYAGGKHYQVTGAGYHTDGVIIDKLDNKVIDYQNNEAVRIFAEVGELCTESSLAINEDEWVITGDPTEGALMIASRKLKYDKGQHHVMIDIPFESENQLMAVRVKDQNNYSIFVKGAPEQIIKRCTKMLDHDANIHSIEDKSLKDIASDFSDKGLRVLALAYSKNASEKVIEFENLHDLVFVGFAGIEDSVRPEAVQAVKDAHSAGIRVVMITGDHIQTAKAVAKSIGIGDHNNEPKAINGIDLNNMSDDDLFKIAPDISVYARVAPQDKLRIVKQLQKHSSIVAMTGDGVNDAPALKQADIGVAMGSGTDVAKEAASMVLLDDNFATIVKAVRRGRVILQNLQHILLYILSTSFGGLLTIAMSVAFGLPLPVLPAQLLWINLVTDGTSTFPIAFEKEHGNVMCAPPRKKNAQLVTKGMIVRIIFAGLIMMAGTLGVFYYYIHGYTLANDVNIYNLEIIRKPQTVAFCILAFFQIWNVQNSRSVKRSLFFNLTYPIPNNSDGSGFQGNKLEKISITQNLPLFGVMLFAVALQLGAVMIPFLNEILGTVPLNGSDWVLIGVVSISIIVFTELLKYLFAFIARSGRLKHYLEI